MNQEIKEQMNKVKEIKSWSREVNTNDVYIPINDFKPLWGLFSMPLDKLYLPTS